jgi:hypothetical protein
VPVYYRLGDVDSRFGLSQIDAKAILTEAERVWESAVDRNLFIYSESSDFAINFIYDERQQLASTEEEWRLRLDIQEKESQQIIETVKNIAADYEKLQVLYEEARLSYENKLSTYNQKVEDSNRSGGASPAVFGELQEEQRELSRTLNNLISQEKQLNSEAEKINELGEKGNQLIESYNAEVLQYNEVYGDLELYTQGDFQRDRINIYKFSDKIELTKVIVHEFGHSLGIGHVEGEESMMYYLMAEQPDEVLLSPEDKAAFAETCGDGTGFAYEARRIIRTALSYL